MAGNEPEHEDMFDPAMVEEYGMMFEDEVPAYSCVKGVWCAWPPPSCHGDSRVCCLIPMQYTHPIYRCDQGSIPIPALRCEDDHFISAPPSLLQPLTPPTPHLSPIVRRRPCAF
jgi:hypothetical protein